MRALTAVVAVGIGTLVIRSSMIVLHRRLRLPPVVERSVPLIGPAVLAALVAQGIFVDQGSLRPLGSWHLAGAVGALVAWRTRSAVWTLVAGMGALWLANAVI